MLVFAYEMCPESLSKHMMEGCVGSAVSCLLKTFVTVVFLETVTCSEIIMFTENIISVIVHFSFSVFPLFFFILLSLLTFPSLTVFLFIFISSVLHFFQFNYNLTTYRIETKYFII